MRKGNLKCKKQWKSKRESVARPEKQGTKRGGGRQEEKEHGRPQTGNGSGEARKGKQSTDKKLHFGTVTGRCKPWNRDPKEKRTKEKKQEKKIIRIRRKKREKTETGMEQEKPEKQYHGRETRRKKRSGRRKTWWPFFVCCWQIVNFIILANLADFGQFW